MGKIVHPKTFLGSLLKLELKQDEEITAEITKEYISKYSAFYSSVINRWLKHIFPEKTEQNRVNFKVVDGVFEYTIKCRFCEVEATVATNRGVYCQSKCRKRFMAAKISVTKYIKDHSISLAKRIMEELDEVTLDEFLKWVYEERT